MSPARVVVAGLGDTGVLSAIHLAGHADVVGISSKPELLSGQELGVRLTRPGAWQEDYRIGFNRYQKLDRVQIVQAVLTGADPEARTVQVRGPDGSTSTEPYDVLLIATGVTNGFWRRPDLETVEQIDLGLRAPHQQLAAASSVMVVGGGAAAVSSALNLASTWPGKQVDLYYPQETALTQHHSRVWQNLERRLRAHGVGLHGGHRAVLPDGFTGDRITTDPVAWSTGQPPASADAVLWTVGRVRPNTGWLPERFLDERGFVRVTPDLRVVGQEDVFAVGDVAATDPLRTSARNRADKLVAANIRAHLAGRPGREYRPAARRWGSVVGVQPNGLDVFAPGGQAFRFPAWSIDRVLQPWIVRRGIYGGVRPYLD